ncbi:hypothetical protein [Deinococcus aquaedulcis]|uniref:hypothetical protein n=1 Tax=Deinococcus aquaedulcis TaxID=2840455 RepID=UPI001C83523C|nr:hypothetical protein [Deinococcus aquaedulcis]
MVGAVLAVTLPPLAPEVWRVGAAVLAFVLGAVAYRRSRGTDRRSVVVFLGAAFLALAFAMPSAGVGVGVASVGAAVLLSAATWKPGKGRK